MSGGSIGFAVSWIACALSVSALVAVIRSERRDRRRRSEVEVADKVGRKLAGDRRSGDWMGT